MKKLSGTWHLSERLRSALFFGLVGIVGLTATGCSSKKKTTVQEPPQVRVWRLEQDVDTLRGTMKAFQKNHKGVILDYKKGDPATYEKDALKSMASKLGPDVWSVPSDWLGDVETLIQPLPTTTLPGEKKETIVERANALFPPGIAEHVISTSGKLYGIPTNVDSLQLYINKRLMTNAFNEYKATLGKNASTKTYAPVQTLLEKNPATWNELIEQSRYVTKREGSVIKRGIIALGTVDNLRNADDIVQLLMMQNGTNIIHTDRRNVVFHQTITTPSGAQVRPGEKALEFFASFSNPSKETYTWNASMPDVLEAFGEGKVAMVIAYSDFANELKVKYPKFTYSVTAVPQISNVKEEAVNLIRFKVETVTKTANNTTLAIAFMKSYAGKTASTGLANSVKLRPPYTETLKKKNEYFNRQVLTGRAIFKYHRVEFDDIFRQMIKDVTQSGVPPSEAVIVASDKLNSLLNRQD